MNDIVVTLDTAVPIPGPPGLPNIIQDDGAPLTARAVMNFVGAGVTATDDGTRTVVTIPGQTPWTGDVDAASHKLKNVSVLGVGNDGTSPWTWGTTTQHGRSPRATIIDGSELIIGRTTPVGPPDTYRYGMLTIAGDGDGFLGFADYRIADPDDKVYASLEGWLDVGDKGSIWFACKDGITAGYSMIVSKLGVSIGHTEPVVAYRLEVNGDINCVGQYRINGVVQGQTPWQTNIDANGKALTGANLIAATFIAASGAMALSATPPTESYFQYMANDVLRIQAGRQGPEGGGNTGSNYAVFMYDDTGALLRIPLFINRSNGLIELDGPLKLANLPSTNPGVGSKQAWYNPADGNRVIYSP